MLCYNHNHNRSLGSSEHCHRCKFWIGEILVMIFFVCIVTTVAAQVFEGGCVQFQHCSSNAECGGGSCMESVCICSIPGGGDVSDPELCNARDDDNDGLTDEDFPLLGNTCDVGIGACFRSGVVECSQDGVGTNCSVVSGTPVQELCGNSLDDDCDGGVDEGCTESVGVSNANAPVSSIVSMNTSAIEYLDTENNISNNSDELLSNTIQQENMITPLYYDEDTVLSSSWIFGESLSLQEDSSVVENSSNNWIYKGFIPNVRSSSQEQSFIDNKTPLFQKQFALLGPITRTFTRDRATRISKKVFTTQSNANTITTVTIPKNIVPDALYVSFDTTQLPSIIKVLKLMQSKSIITQYYQPFLSIDIPYYRIEFDTKYYSFMLSFFQKMPGVKDFRSVPVFSIQTDEVKNKSKQRYLKEIGIVSNSHCLLEQKKYRNKIVVAVVDNAFDVQHPVFANNDIQQIDVANNDSNVIPPSIHEDWSHGTIAASLVDGFESKKFVGSALGTTKLILVKGTKDTAEATDITHGIESVVAAADAGAEIISLSRGTNTDIPVFKEVMKKIVDKGILVVAAAGNQSSSDFFYPAAYDGVIAVGAYDTQQQKAEFSNFGPRVDVMAPGVDILAAGLTNSYITTQGTSEAGPIVAGVLALQKSLYSDSAFARSISTGTFVSGIPALYLHSCDEAMITSGNVIHDSTTPDIMIENSGSSQATTTPFGGSIQSSHHVAPRNSSSRMVYDKSMLVLGFLLLGTVLILWGIKNNQEEKLANQPRTSIHQ